MYIKKCCAFFRSVGRATCAKSVVNLTGLEPDSLKTFFLAPFGGNALVVCSYDGGPYRQNPLPNLRFKALRGFHERKIFQSKGFECSHTQVLQTKILRGWGIFRRQNLSGSSPVRLTTLFAHVARPTLRKKVQHFFIYI